jgi:bifunctional UDP-N-acetylglucosamine pyrophosphorylase / glucosamine-1-phosphate N-acetyltransferase
MAGGERVSQGPLEPLFQVRILARQPASQTASSSAHIHRQGIVSTDDPNGSVTSLAVIILAAGLGTRMKSRTPKELQPLLGRPMLDYVLRAADVPAISQRIVVLSPAKASIADQLPADVQVAWQDEQLGTGHATACALDQLNDDVTHVAVLFGDHPLLERHAISGLVETTTDAGALITLLTTIVDDPAAYGRVRRNAGQIVRIVEAKDDSRQYDGPVEIYSGISCYERTWLERYLPSIQRSPGGEFYLTSLVEMAAGDDSMSVPVVAVQADPTVAYGVNDRVDLARAEQILRERILERLMRDGVTVADPGSTFVDDSVKIGMDSRIEPFTIIRGETVIGEGTTIGPQSVISDSQIGSGCEVVSSHLESAKVGDRVHIGPFAHLRSGARLEDDVHVGNYAEIKESHVGRLSRIGHFSYIGDSKIGEDVNIGAGTVTCNYDGKTKHRTNIGDRCFIGSDTMLVAPVSVGDDAVTGAGSVVNRDVTAGETVVGVPARARGNARRQQVQTDGEGTAGT